MDPLDSVCPLRPKVPKPSMATSCKTETSGVSNLSKVDGKRVSGSQRATFPLPSALLQLPAMPSNAAPIRHPPAAG